MMDEFRLPADIEQHLVEMATDPNHGPARRRLLAFSDVHMRDAFLEALHSPDMTVHATTCEDEPQEICVRAQGRSSSGALWSSNSIILLEPDWSRTAHVSQALAEDIVDDWERLQTYVLPKAAAA